MIAIQINALGDPRRELRALELGLAPAQLNKTIGISATEAVRNHLFFYNETHANRLGGPRTDFYTKAAKATHFDIIGDKVIVSINSVGIAQRYFGGRIAAQPGHFLTIPAIPEAYGKRASEFSDLELVFFTHGAALVRRAASRIGFKRDRKTGLTRAFSKGEQGGEVVFWLKREITQSPNPDVLPSQEKLEGMIQGDVASYIDRLASRGGSN